MGGDRSPVSSDKFERNAGKIITALLTTIAVAAGAFMLDARQQLALQGKDIERIAESIWTKQQQETYDARVQAKFDAMAERMKRVEQGK